MAQGRDVFRANATTETPLRGRQLSSGRLSVHHDEQLTVSLGDPPPPWAARIHDTKPIEPPRIILASALALVVIGTGCGLPIETGGARLAAAAGLTVLTLALVFLADGLTADAFQSHRELVRALACSSAIGLGGTLGIRSLWPDAVAENVTFAVPAAFVFVGLIVERSVVAGCGTAGTRPSALLLAVEGEDEFCGQSTTGGDLQIVAKLAPPFDPHTVATALAAHRPSMVLLASPLKALNLDLVRACSSSGARIFLAADPLFALAACPSIVRLAGRPWVALRALPLGGRHRRAKRALDLGLLVLASPLIVPLVTIVGIAVALTSRGGMVYRQIRIGEGGRPFILYKFRSMHEDAERETGPVLAQPDDPRATPLGHFLRRTRLDELPQLWNVMRGEMSLVGPRPERPEFVRGYRGIRDYEARTLLKPGLTGLAQLVAGYAASPENKLRCDLLYLTSYSLRLDLRLIVATATDFLRGFPHG